MSKDRELEFGPVVIENWFDETKIGYYDDNTWDEDGEDYAVVFLGDMLLTLHTGHYLIPHEYLREVTTNDLWERRNKIFSTIGAHLLKTPKKQRPSYKDRFLSLLEFAYIDNVLMDRLYMARFNVLKEKGLKVFISHSSKDKHFANWMFVDIANTGHQPWLDEWNIRVGESIPKKISTGLSECDVVIVVLSKNSVASAWVENEWQSKYWREVKSREIMVLPILMEECEIPYLLESKKYADFTHDYQAGLESLLSALFEISALNEANKALKSQASPAGTPQSGAP